MTKKLKVHVTRDGTLFIAGLGGIAYETLVGNGERPTLIILFAAMVGLPAFLRTDERARHDDTTAATTTKPPDEGKAR